MSRCGFLSRATLPHCFLRQYRTVLAGVCGPSPYQPMGVVSNGRVHRKLSSEGNGNEVSKAHLAAAERANRSDEPTIFEKIANKEIPASIVYEDEQVA